MIAETKRGWVLVGAKGLRQGPYPTKEAAFKALYGGASESCSDGACGAQGV